MNLPNRLTIFRIILIPIVVLVYLFPYAQFGIEPGVLTIGGVDLSIINLICLIIYLVAAITDYFDGQIARKRNMQTTFGKFADPIADKMLTTTMFLMFSSRGLIPVVPVIIMVCRDIVVDGCRMIAASNGKVVAAQMLGKLKTVLQMVSIALVLLNNLPFEIWGLPVTDIMIWFSAFVSFASGVSYFSQLKGDIMESI
ncbi:CDP-diacylglycerol--glycerol-3-phosphate 3-phosphatidyltransferase [Erysipelotrichaceae bacterium Oil+RF-744-GAM-WT-6]|jgi:CDP-diacylglycerol--glycerol-3-phosphate 3-phosphatidyltransferase|uniref:CDP-diacylglycerol--glycerol-3-phosphate 3-phosphatidyltransferase n=1 Tax=Stecheria intestinalis TaxID=2606630 RepID=A0A7X2NSV8_9FIRM|nr:MULTISPECIES: CDP-diacylglycerol--glycerol-3-phosphate 3-phosphatidyltransferase [Erysipelotrichaceae]MSS58976.1 CDP-diacylglycerol--glycerol-3-phosphate 3-phosphatidyltransferase [Stecheria intestinalis]